MPWRTWSVSPHFFTELVYIIHLIRIRSRGRKKSAEASRRRTLGLSLNALRRSGDEWLLPPRNRFERLREGPGQDLPARFASSSARRTRASAATDCALSSVDSSVHSRFASAVFAADA